MFRTHLGTDWLSEYQAEVRFFMLRSTRLGKRIYLAVRILARDGDRRNFQIPV